MFFIVFTSFFLISLCPAALTNLYKFSNPGKLFFKYILALLDVFTRKAYVRPMKKKDVSAVLTNLQDIYLNDAYIPIPMHDNAFLTDFPINISHNLYKIVNRVNIVRAWE